jgi:hypothetical protein
MTTQPGEPVARKPGEFWPLVWTSAVVIVAGALWTVAAYRHFSGRPTLGADPRDPPPRRAGPPGPVWAVRVQSERARVRGGVRPLDHRLRPPRVSRAGKWISSAVIADQSPVAERAAASTCQEPATSSGREPGTNTKRPGPPSNIRVWPHPWGSPWSSTFRTRGASAGRRSHARVTLVPFRSSSARAALIRPNTSSRVLLRPS